ncbi:MAG: hypothetical protein AAGA53_14435 [Pseudomonadota bacterium]
MTQTLVATESIKILDAFDCLSIYQFGTITGCFVIYIKTKAASIKSD